MSTDFPDIEIDSEDESKRSTEIIVLDDGTEVPLQVRYYRLTGTPNNQWRDLFDDWTAPFVAQEGGLFNLPTGRIPGIKGEYVVFHALANMLDAQIEQVKKALPPIN